MEEQADKTVSVRLTQKEYDKLARLARLLRVSKSEALRLYINQAQVTTAAKPGEIAIIQDNESEDGEQE